ncbi:glycosyltransferase family 2 protein [Roseivirga sp.]|uniref:glycosyltransferase family 2 protein n=1 Tax=Roseivirga sp. TaxID=1964215 RepID=UPI003B8E5D3D
MNQPKVSIITVNYKQPAVTCELLDSIRELSYPNLETIVVDNGQLADDTVIYEIHLPSVKVINVKENSGFAKGNNIGIKAATGDYYLLLNNDTEIEDGVIERLIETLQDTSIGAVSPIIKYFDNQEIQFAGFTEINSITGRNNILQEAPKEELTDTPYIHGAAVMTTKSVVEACGGLPEDYFLYYEELDWSRIIRSYGYSLKVLNTVSVLHKESVTTGKNSPLKVYYQTRNRVHFMRASQVRSSWMFMAYFILISLPKNFIIHLLKGEIKHLRAFRKAFSHSIFQKKIGFQNF